VFRVGCVDPASDPFDPQAVSARANVATHMAAAVLVGSEREMVMSISFNGK
jgi:hypothetical protein